MRRKLEGSLRCKIIRARRVSTLSTLARRAFIGGESTRQGQRDKASNEIRIYGRMGSFPQPAGCPPVAVPPRWAGCFERRVNDNVLKPGGWAKNRPAIKFLREAAAAAAVLCAGAPFARDGTNICASKRGKQKYLFASNKYNEGRRGRFERGWVG